MSVPFTRTLQYVLRDQLQQTGVARFLIAEVSSIPDANHVNIDQGGVVTKIPRLASYQPEPGEPAYCLAGDTLIIALGAVGGIGARFLSGFGAPTGAVGTAGAIYLDIGTGRLWYRETAGWQATAFGRIMPLQPTYGNLRSG